MSAAGKSGVHQAAAVGYENAADAYSRGRPDYPAAVTGWLNQCLRLHPGTTVVDLGAGTGKFTPRLMATGAKVIAVEPVTGMRERLAHDFPNIEVLAGTAESIPLPDASVHAVVCAQSFHWFATRAALAEIHRVLQPGGTLGLIWNVRDDRVAWVARLAQLVNRFEDNAPRYHTNAWRQVFPFPGFGPLHEQHFAHGHTGAPEDVILNRVRSVSFIAALPAEDRSKLEAEVSALIAAEPALRGKSMVTMPYETAAFHTIKDASSG